MRMQTTIPSLTRETTGLLLIDAQERIMPAMRNAKRALERMRIAALAARALGMPIRVTEQYPRGLGRTVPALKEALGDAYLPVEKTRFSAAEAVLGPQPLEAENILLCGIETHVCVLQTALDLLNAGANVFPIADAVASRRAGDRRIGLRRMRQSGAFPVSTEMFIFETLQDAKDPLFKPLQRLIK